MVDTVEVELEGVEIETVRKMTDEEMEANHWSRRTIHADPPVIVLENGTKLFPSQDPEGNGPGALFGETGDGQGFGL